MCKMNKLIICKTENGIFKRSISDDECITFCDNVNSIFKSTIFGCSINVTDKKIACSKSTNSTDKSTAVNRNAFNTNKAAFSKIC